MPGRRPRRGVLGGVAAAATAAASAAAACAPQPARALQPLRPSASPDAAAPPDPTASPAAASTPAVVPSATPIPQPRLVRLDVERVVEPLWVGDRILYYAQPPGAQGGTWAVLPDVSRAPNPPGVADVAPRFERPVWGYYSAGGQLLAAPRPARRDTYVLHAPTGREWTLPTTNPPIFSPDGTVVAFPTAAPGQPGGAPPGPGMGFSGAAPTFVLSSVVLAGADGQGARTVQLPLNGSVLAWLPAPDGTPNARLLLTGRRAAGDDPSLWAYDTRGGAVVEIARSRRLVGALPSPDGTWVAWVAMWNRDPSQDGLWVARTDGSQRRRLDLVGGYRWTGDSRLVVVPHRASRQDSHQLWLALPDSGVIAPVATPDAPRFRISNYNWDCSPDGRSICFVSSDDKALWLLDGVTSPRVSAAPPVEARPPTIPAPPAAGAGPAPYRLPFATPPGPSTWYVAHWYGVTTGGYRGRSTTYSQGQGIHFGVDFAAPCGTEVVAVAPGRVVAIDGDYGSPPHNVVLQLFDGNLAMYGHLGERTRHVQVGQTVEPGRVLGNTGDSIAPYDCTRNPHLHLEIRKGGRATATNPVPYFDANWDDATLGVWPGPRFERDLDDPRRYQFLDEQPDIWFGGPIITNFARPWPP